MKPIDLEDLKKRHQSVTARAQALTEFSGRNLDTPIEALDKLLFERLGVTVPSTLSLDEAKVLGTKISATINSFNQLHTKSILDQYESVLYMEKYARFLRKYLQSLIPPNADPSDKSAAEARIAQSERDNTPLIASAKQAVEGSTKDIIQYGSQIGLDVRSFKSSRTSIKERVDRVKYVGDEDYVDSLARQSSLLKFRAGVIDIEKSIGYAETIIAAMYLNARLDQAGHYNFAQHPVSSKITQKNLTHKMEEFERALSAINASEIALEFVALMSNPSGTGPSSKPN